MKPQPTAKNEVRLSGLGDWSAREHRLGSPLISVGSDRENDLVLEHPTVSRKHALLRHQEGRYTVTDLGSTNGTFVNGRRIKKAIQISPGDEIGFGSARFALLGGTGLKRAGPQPRAPLRMIGATAGIVLFALTGFLITRYALDLGRIQSRPTNPATEEKAASIQPMDRPAETPEPAEPSSAPAIPAVTDADTFSPLWLKQLNDFRASVNLAPVESDPKLSDGDRNHAIYLLKNFATEIHEGSLGVEVHSEDATNSWYTPEGAEAARNSDIAEQGTTLRQKLPDPQGWAIAGWMVAPFHRFPILSPLLYQAGFAFDCENGMCVALLNVHSGAYPAPRTGTPLEHPILYPPEGASIPASMRTLENEWPNPISGCDGYAFPTGLPVTVQLGPMVEAQLSSFSITTEDGGSIEACGFDANSYYNSDPSQRSNVISNLRGHGAIVIVPRHPLDSGVRYDVMVTVSGHDYKWSFTVAH